MSEIVKPRCGFRSVNPVFLFLTYFPLVPVIRKDRGSHLGPDSTSGIFVERGGDAIQARVTK